MSFREGFRHNRSPLSISRLAWRPRLLSNQILYITVSQSQKVKAKVRQAVKFTEAQVRINPDMVGRPQSFRVHLMYHGTLLGWSPFGFVIVHRVVTRRSATVIKNNTCMKKMQHITCYFTKMLVAQIHQLSQKNGISNSCMRCSSTNK